MTEQPERGADAGNEPRGEGPNHGATVGAIIVVIVLVAGGVWLMNEFADNARYAKCMAARHRNCDDINYRTAPEAPPEKR